MALLGSTLTQKEAEVALELLDKDDNQRISLEEFQNFLNGWTRTASSEGASRVLTSDRRAKQGKW